MSEDNPGYQLAVQGEDNLCLQLNGTWIQGSDHPPFSSLQDELVTRQPVTLTVDGTALGQWDSVLMAFLLQLYNHCLEKGIDFSSRNLPRSPPSRRSHGGRH
jgi:phospholipid/cholesterol/gamma-HCH transport system permease protein